MNSNIINNPMGGGDVPPIITLQIMITVKKATKKQAAENAKKMKAAMEKMKAQKENKQ